ncbi:MAG: DsbA family protein [Nanoarchaeota archaeon]|nr:DsbA family protein [Nanoarchaeota archaeon]
MKDEEKIIKDIEKEEHKIMKSMKKNPWILSSIFLSILVIMLLFLNFQGGLSGKIISKNDVGNELLKFYSETGAVGLTIKDIKDVSGLYLVTFNYQNKEVPIYVTKDGKFAGKLDLISNPNSADVASNQQQTQQSIIKSDKPVVEAFIFSYCPYGLQFEKALFPVYDLLKNKADFRIVAIGAMHGEYEKVETLRQISIEQLYNKDKLIEYLKEFNANSNIGSCRGDDACLNKYLPSIYSKLGIDKTKIENYMKSDALKIYDEQNQRANSLGVSGSPTFVINGEQVQVDRNPNSIKEAICNTFNTKPEECSKTLSTSQASPGFG